MAKKATVSLFPKPIDNLDLVGHEEVKKNFMDAWENRNKYPIHPVWILSGPQGIGKATLAYNLARQIFSDAYGRSINDIAAQMSVGGIGDLFIVDIEHNLGTTKTISVDTVRNATEKLQMFSMGESWRVIIIDSMDELSRDTPNTLLKTLEEPPAKTIFFLIAHSLDRVLPTIRSRSRIEKMRPLSGTEIFLISQKLLPYKEIGGDLLKISGGSFGRIAKMIETGADTLFSDAKNIITSKSNSADILALAKRVAKFPENMTILLDIISEFKFADLYSSAQKEIRLMNILHLDPEIVTFKILSEIKKCV